jgi:hypothetical protein
MRIAITMRDVIAFIIDTAFNNHEIIGDSVSCNRMMIDLYKPIIRSFMVFLLSTVNIIRFAHDFCPLGIVQANLTLPSLIAKSQWSIVGSCHSDFEYIDFSLQR